MRSQLRMDLECMKFEPHLCFVMYGNRSLDDCCVVEAVAAGCSWIQKEHCHGTGFDP